MIFLSRVQSLSDFDSLSHGSLSSLISLSQEVQILRRLQKTSQLKKVMDKSKSSKIVIS